MHSAAIGAKQQHCVVEPETSSQRSFFILACSFHDIRDNADLYVRQRDQPSLFGYDSFRARKGERALDLIDLNCVCICVCGGRRFAVIDGLYPFNRANRKRCPHDLADLLGCGLFFHIDYGLNGNGNDDFSESFGCLGLQGS